MPKAPVGADRTPGPVVTGVCYLAYKLRVCVWAYSQDQKLRVRYADRWTSIWIYYCLAAQLAVP